MIAAYWERAEFPHALLPRFHQLGIGGGHLRGYGCQGLSVLGAAMAAVELVSICWRFFCGLGGGGGPACCCSYARAAEP